MGNGTFDIWLALAGVAFFLLGMSFLENALKKLAGRKFKLFLKKQTSGKLRGIAGGAVVTGILQSSSVVNLMVLAFVGAGVITMQNALAVILGANLGTTFGNWILATLGFSAGVESFAYPIAGIAGLVFAIFSKEGKASYWSGFLFGFAILFIGLGYLKTGMEGFVKSINLDAFNDYPAIVFLLLGLVTTALVQSSSATVAITLSALHVNAIGLYAAMAIVLGSETGTGLKLILASMRGNAAKKRVAWGNIIFNTVTSVVVLLLLAPVYYFITEVVAIGNNLIALVFFQVLVNITGIIIFYPLLKPLGKFLERRFTSADKETLFIQKTGTADFDLAVDALQKETFGFLDNVIEFCAEAFALNLTRQRLAPEEYAKKSLMEKYEHIKSIHGLIHNYYVQLQKEIRTTGETNRLDNIMFSVRNGMYAAKSMKDAYYDAELLRNSSNDIKYGYFIQAKEKINSFLIQVLYILSSGDKKSGFEDLVRIYTAVQDGYNSSLKDLYDRNISDHLSDVEISTLLNFNRELYSSFKAMILAVKDLLLEKKEADYFDDLPGFIR